MNFQRLGHLIDGEIPKGFIMSCIAHAGIGKTSLGLTLVAELLRKDVKSVVVTLDEPARRIQAGLEGLGIRLPRKKLTIIDGYSWVSGERLEEAEALSGLHYLKNLNLTDLNITLDKIIKTVGEGAFIVLDSVSTILNYHSEANVMKFLHITMARIRKMKDIAILFFVREVHSKSFYNTIVSISDGLIVLKRRKVEGRLLRKIEVQRMRNVKIMCHELPFTLQKGFQILPPFALRVPKKTNRFTPIPDTATHYSTGSDDLDEILGGGLPKGSYSLLEKGENVPMEIVNYFLYSIVCNFLNNGNGAFILPPGGFSSIQVLSYIEPYTDEEVVNERLRIAEYGKNNGKPYTVPLRGKSIAEDYLATLEAIKEIKGTEDRPTFRIISIDTVNSICGPEAELKVLGRTVTDLKTTKDVRINVATPAIVEIKQLRAFSDLHLKMAAVGRNVIIWGVKPHTGLYNVEIDFTLGYPKVKLTSLL